MLKGEIIRFSPVSATALTAENTFNPKAFDEEIISWLFWGRSNGVGVTSFLHEAKMNIPIRAIVSVLIVIVVIIVVVVIVVIVVVVIVVIVVVVIVVVVGPPGWRPFITYIPQG